MIQVKGLSDLNQDPRTYEKPIMWFDSDFLWFESHDSIHENMLFKSRLHS